MISLVGLYPMFDPMFEPHQEFLDVVDSTSGANRLVRFHSCGLNHLISHISLIKILICGDISTLAVLNISDLGFSSGGVAGGTWLWGFEWSDGSEDFHGLDMVHNVY